MDDETRAKKKDENFQEHKLAEKFIRELFEEGGTWKSQKDIAKAVNKRHKDYHFSQSTISRTLKKMKAKKLEGGGWGLGSLEEAFEQKRRFSALSKFLKEAVVPSGANFSKGFEIYALKTKPNYNTLLAKKIRTTFEDVIPFIICPNDTDIIIFHGGSNCEKDDAIHKHNNDFEKTILEYLGVRD